MARKLLEFGFVAAIFLGVGAMGATPAIPRALVEVVLFSLGLLLVFALPQNSGRSLAKLLPIPALLFAWIAVQWLASRRGKIGVDTWSIQSRALVFAACIVSFFLALEICRARASRIRFVLALIGLALFESVYGLAQYFLGWQYIWTIPRRFYLGSASGTFINHNHFSGLLEMILPLSLMLSLYYAQKLRRHPRPRSRGEFLSGLGRPDLLKCLLLLLASIVIFLGIVFSFSRMGLISAIASLALLALIVWSSRRRNPQPAWFILLLLSCGVAGTAWLGAGPVVRHFQALSRDDSIERGSEGRRALWADTVQLIRSRPWTGSGLGCFEIAFTRFQSVELDYTLDHAHNDYLEFAAELGIPAATLLFAMLYWIAARSLQAGLLARSSLSRAHALGALGGASALLVHSLADFNLQIPANALVFCSLLGVGYTFALEARAEKQVASQARHIEAALPLATRPSEGSAQPRTAEEVEAPLKMSFNAPRSG